MGGILWRLGLVSRERFLEMQRSRNAWRASAMRRLARLQEAQSDLEVAEEDVAELKRDLEDCKRSLENSVVDAELAYMIIEEKDAVIQELNGRMADLERDVRERDELIRGVRQLAKSTPKRRGRDEGPAW